MNTSLTTLRKLAQKKYRDREGLYMLEGAAAVRDAILSDTPPITVLFDKRTRGRETDADVISAAEDQGVLVREVEEGELVRISGLTTAPPVAAVMRLPENPEPSIPTLRPLVLALDRIRDPGNLGTLIRAAAFYGVPELWLSEGTADPFNPKVTRAAMAAHLGLRMCRNIELEPALDQARKAGSHIYATVVGGEEEIAPLTGESSPAVLLLGNEPAGIAPALLEQANKRVAIARRGPVDSLNVAMAGVIFLDRLLAR